MKRTDHYAGNQVRLFLGELKNGTHTTKVKAVQHFQSYIKSYKPNISDDNVDFLYTGNIDGSSTLGLLYFCGVDSEKHDGQLKRICGPLITLLRWLVQYDEDNIFYERFVHLSVDELAKVNFPKHILRNSDGKLGGISIPGQSRSGSSEDAFDLLSTLLADHRNTEDEPEPVDIGLLLNGSKVCQDRFEEWLQKSNVEHINQTLAALKATPASTAMALVAKRPSRWADVTFKCIPLQEGEDLGSVEAGDEPEEPPPVLDPMGLDDRDLRITQDLYASGRLAKSAMQKRATMARLSTDALSVITFGGKPAPAARTREPQPAADDDDDEEDDEDEDPLAALVSHTREKKLLPSVLPGDKAFSTPLFLSLVQGNRTFAELKAGLAHLKEYQRQQSSRREHLVRTHFGLFVQCADGLEWLKLYRKGIYKRSELPKNKTYRRSSVDDPRLSTTKGQMTMDQGMQKLSTAQVTLEMAKVEAKSTLAPILERMKQSREIRSAEKVLKSMAALLEYPHSMRLALDKGDLQEVVALYQRVQAIPSTTSLKIVQKIRSAAEEVVLDLRRQCFASLLCFSGNFSAIMRNAQLLLALEGSAFYLELLRQCFVRHLVHFWDAVQKAKEKFCLDIADAHDKGKELNLMSRSNLFTAAERENVASVIKRYSSGSGRAKKSRPQGSQSAKRPSTSASAARDANSHSMMSRRSFSKGSFSSSSGLPPDYELEMNEITDDFEDSTGSLSNANAFLDEDDSASVANEGISGRFERSFSVDKGLGISIDEADPFDLLADVPADYCELLCSVVRKAFASNLMDITTSWFPLLYKLVFEIAQHQSLNKPVTSSSGAGASGALSVPIPLAQVGKTASVATSTLRRAMCSPNRLFAVSLGAVADFIQQMAVGVGDSLRSPALPTEVINAFADLDQYICATNTAHGIKVALSGYDIDIGNHAVNPVHLAEVFGTGLMRGHLRQHEHHQLLADCFVMHEALEAAMTAALRIVSKQADGTTSVSNAGAGTSQLKMLHLDGLMDSLAGKSATSNPALQALIAEVSSCTVRASCSFAMSDHLHTPQLDFTTPVSPYFEGMQTLSLLAREEERHVTQKILGKLLERSYLLGDVYLAEMPAPIPVDGSPGPGSGLEYSPISVSRRQSTSEHGKTSRLAAGSVEAAVADLESLLLRGLEVMKTKVQRPDWVAALVFETLLQKIFLSFLEKMKRKMMLIEEARAGGDAPVTSPGASPTTKRSRKKTQTGATGMGMNNTRASMHQSQLILQSLEEDLRCLELGWSRELSAQAPSTDGNNNPQSACATVGKSKAAAWVDFMRGAVRLRSHSLPRIIRHLLLLFPIAADTHTAPSAAFVSAKKTTVSASQIHGPSGTGGAAAGSLLNRLFAFDTAAESAAPAPALEASYSPSPSSESHRAGDSLYDRVLSGAEAQCRILQDSSSAQSAGALFKLLPSLGDIAQIEADAAAKYASYRLTGIKTILHSAFALLVRKEANGQPGDAEDSALPKHIARIILALHEEKKMLTQSFGNVTVESGGDRDDYASTKDTPATPKPSDKDNDDEHDDGDDRMVILTVRPNLTPQSAKRSDAFRGHGSRGSQRYGEYLYRTLCCGLLEQYEDLLKKLAQSSFGDQSNATSGASAKAYRSPRTLHQGVEEWEFFKVLCLSMCLCMPRIPHPFPLLYLPAGHTATDRSGRQHGPQVSAEQCGVGSDGKGAQRSLQRDAAGQRTAPSYDAVIIDRCNRYNNISDYTFTSPARRGADIAWCVS